MGNVWGQYKLSKLGVLSQNRQENIELILLVGILDGIITNNYASIDYEESFSILYIRISVSWPIKYYQYYFSIN